MVHPLCLVSTDPWAALELVLDGPLHPGGIEATEALLDRADVSEGTRLLDAGCGAGQAVALARERDARPVGLDRRPRGEATVRGDIAHLPFRNASVDVVLAECVLGPAPDHTLDEFRRVLHADGRVALSAVVVEGDIPDLGSVAEALCLADDRGRAEVVSAIENAGLEVGDVRGHHEDLLAMRDQIADTVDYEGLLAALDDDGQRLLEDVRALEAAIDEGRIGYISLVATPSESAL